MAFVGHRAALVDLRVTGERGPDDFVRADPDEAQRVHLAVAVHRVPDRPAVIPVAGNVVDVVVVGTIPELLAVLRAAAARVGPLRRQPPARAVRRLAPDLGTGELEAAIRTRDVVVDRLARVLEVKRIRRVADRRGPAHVPAGQLVPGFILRIHVLAGVVVAPEEVPEVLEVAGPTFATPLGRALEADFQARERPRGHPQAEQQRMVVVAPVAVHVTHEGRQAPRPDPAQPLALERLRHGPVQRDGRNRPRAVRQQQAALPA